MRPFSGIRAGCQPEQLPATNQHARRQKTLHVQVEAPVFVSGILLRTLSMAFLSVIQSHSFESVQIYLLLHYTPGASNWDDR
jgi:hypothetical protein